MIFHSNKPNLHRLITVCLEEEKLYAYSLIDKLTVSVETGIMKACNTHQDFTDMFAKFSSPYDIILLVMTEQSRTKMCDTLSSNLEVIQQRVLTVIPIQFGGNEYSYNFFTPLPVLSSTGDIKLFASKVSRLVNNYLHIDLSELKPWVFENIVKDILKTYNFYNIILAYSDHVDFGYDMMCNYNSDSNKDVKENWLIEIKMAKERLTIRFIDKLLKQDRTHYPSDSKVMMVTNGTLTSAIFEYVSTVKKQQLIDIYIVDGWKLCNLIAHNNNLVKEYFPYE